MWDKVGNVANVIQILSAIPLIFTAWLFLVRARRYRQRVEEMENIVTERPMALAISLAGTDIAGQVQQFLATSGMNITVRSLTKSSGVTKDNIHRLLRELLSMKSQMTADGVTEVHLFLACPLVFATGVGAILDNWVPVKVYHLNRDTGSYEFWTPLYKGFIPGLEKSEFGAIFGAEPS